ncbi:Holliday junction branch migration DNA helicase RuvB [Cellulosilyticum sp. ST5]|uniref:Holliday junction branch migration complex subunit RuvB n=1 Tax=Cellulosilyticum lentocellum (strain ATCC 49066 / DSM 5427 / NCIMB 11756 / RHM5) TaxID=642492 RepID=F2JSW6_CELLD|nr:MULTISPECIES: Holliday junction branch migration DNA helicase RuvB [Cellulosilyticum]ADZ84087.1 Holliday junction ATP-dependent DNA helicase ruvB [Cellulosilyticum lentocellum DSM 5427]QEH69536.1 Holliday junction branch migration DNA helicase RuvB [Cellulosilyticum sp. WCF-2]
MEKRIMSSDLQLEDNEIESNIRPLTLSDYIGQTAIKENIKIFIEAAKQRGEALDHVLLYGPPGLGKTTMAGVIASEMGVKFKVTSGPAIEKPGDIAAILNNLQHGDILFIDEIHRMSRHVEEVLYSAMEDYCIDIVVGKGPAAKSIRLTLPKFTLIGATTRAGMLSSPLRDRFGIIQRLEYYTMQELGCILKRTAAILQTPITEEAALELAKCSRGTPRVANRLLKRVRDIALIKYDNHIDEEVCTKALELLSIDRNGLDDIDRRIIQAIALQFKGGPVGLDTLAAAIGEERDTLEDVYEPYLIQQGYMQRTPRGRMLAPKAYETFELKTL